MTVKPYTERPEGNGSNDEDIAIETWNKHLLRENSIITENFGSLMRSELTCPDCGKVVVSFDYQQSLQVAIPKLVTLKTIQIMFIPCEIPKLFIKSRDGMSQDIITKILQCFILVMRPIKFAFKVNANANFETIMNLFNQLFKNYSSDLFTQLKTIVPSLFHSYIQDSNSLYKCDSIRLYEMSTPEHGNHMRNSILINQYAPQDNMKRIRLDSIIGAYNVPDTIPMAVNNNNNPQMMLKIVLLQVSVEILILSMLATYLYNNLKYSFIKLASLIINYYFIYNIIWYIII